MDSERMKPKTLNRVLLGSVVGSAAVISMPVILYAAGFSSIGPIGGSLAAKWMAGTAIGGGIKSGSMYAVLQSTAMTGAIVSSKTIIMGGVVGGALGVADRAKKLYGLAGPRVKSADQ